MRIRALPSGSRNLLYSVSTRFSRDKHPAVCIGLLSTEALTSSSIESFEVPSKPLQRGNRARDSVRR